MIRGLVKIGLIFCIYLSSIASLEAEGKWWEKAIHVFKKSNDTESTGLNWVEVGGALKDALLIASETVVNQLGDVDGFNADAAIHIALPKELDTVRTMLRKVGLSRLADDLELKLNRAAEAAAPQAKALFLQSISAMTFDDVKGIYEGGDDAATRYFQEKMSTSLREDMRPIVENSLSTVGAIQDFNKLMGKYRALPFVPDIEADLTDHVIQKGMDGIFYYMAKEEAAIREDPMRQTTILLKKVFGDQ